MMLPLQGRLIRPTTKRPWTEPSPWTHRTLPSVSTFTLRHYSGPSGGAGEYAKPQRLSGWQGQELFVQQSKSLFLQ